MAVAFAVALVAFWLLTTAAMMSCEPPGWGTTAMVLSGAALVIVLARLADRRACARLGHRQA